MVRVRKMVRETDKTDRKEEREAERLVVHIGAAEVGAKFINNTCTVTLLLGFITLYHSRKRKNGYLILAASLYVLTLQASRHYPNY